MVRFTLKQSPHYYNDSAARDFIDAVPAGSLAMVLDQLPPDDYCCDVPRLKPLLDDGMVVLYYCFDSLGLEVLDLEIPDH